MLETEEKTRYNSNEEKYPNVRKPSEDPGETWRDMACRQLLSHTDVLALILANTVPEFEGMALADVEKCIGPVDVDATIPVDATGTHRIYGISNVDCSVDCQPIIYDMHFLAYIPEDRVRDGKLIAEMHINIEAQKNANPGYYLPKRATYYASRLISSQKGIDWKNSDYNAIRRVYSVWLCMKPPKEKSGFINHYGVVERKVYGNVSFPEEQYTDFNYVIVGLDDLDATNIMVKTLSCYFSDSITPKEKYVYLEEAGITVTADMMKRTEAMYSLIEDYEERGMAKGMAQGMVQCIANMMRNFNMPFEQVAKGANIAPGEIERYRAWVEEYLTENAQESNKED